jgi:hypothetical protein
VVAGFGITAATALGKDLSNSITGGKELEVTVSSISRGPGNSVIDFNIPSILEKELSPVERILNYEIILSVLIPVNMCIIILI